MLKNNSGSTSNVAALSRDSIRALVLGLKMNVTQVRRSKAAVGGVSCDREELWGGRRRGWWGLYVYASRLRI